MLAMNQRPARVSNVLRNLDLDRVELSGTPGRSVSIVSTRWVGVAVLMA